MGVNDWALGPGRPSFWESFGGEVRDPSAVRFDSPDGAYTGRKGRAAGLHVPGGFAVKVECVTTGRNWSQLEQRSVMRRQRVDVKGGTPIVAPLGNKQQRCQLTKAELREQAEAAVLAWREGQTSKNK